MENKHLPLYLINREVPDPVILEIVRKGMTNHKGINQISRENKISNTKVSRYYTWIRRKKY